jgi:hypothetical protein
VYGILLRFRSATGGVTQILINPSNPLVSLVKVKESLWNRYRVWGNPWGRRKPMINLVGNFSYRNNLRLNRKAYTDFKSYVKAGI